MHHMATIIYKEVGLADSSGGDGLTSRLINSKGMLYMCTQSRNV